MSVHVSRSVADALLVGLAEATGIMSDPVVRGAIEATRRMARSVAKFGVCKRELAQLSYAIGVAQPASRFWRPTERRSTGLLPTLAGR